MKTIDIPCTGYTVKADWYEGKSTDKILLFLMGWPLSTRESYKDLITDLVTNTGMSAIVFEYSGIGDSPFDKDLTRPAQHFLEVINVFDQLKVKHPKAEISVVGTSYGGLLATQLTKYRAFNNLVLRVPAIFKPSDFYSFNKDIDWEWTQKIFRKDKEALAKHPLLARAAAFKGRTLVVVHENDAEVPTETTDAYIKAFNANVYTAAGFEHSFSPPTPADGEAYKRAISEWLLSGSKVKR